MNRQLTKVRAEQALRWLVILCLMLGSGCSTVVSHSLSKGAPPAYAGTWLNSHVITDAGSAATSDGGAALLFTYSLIDFPFSLVADTICLPYDLIAAE